MKSVIVAQKITAEEREVILIHVRMACDFHSFPLGSHSVCM